MTAIKPISTGPNSWDVYLVNHDQFLVSFELTNFDAEGQVCELIWTNGDHLGEVFDYVEAFRFILKHALFSKKLRTLKTVVPIEESVPLAAITQAGFLAGRDFGSASKRARRFTGDRYDLVRSIAETQMAEHLDLNLWSFGWDSAKKRLGVCKYDQHLISLSRYFVDLHSLEEIDQVMRHEIAHALAGPKAGHGPKWKKIATEIGYNHKRISGDEIGNATAKLIGTCPNGHVVYRHRQPKSPLSCSRCAPRFDRNFLITWTKR
jgi:predicted SprT family Zn-dependent metalloprotease